MREIGVAIVGTGFMGPTHAEALRRVGVDVVGILGSRPEKSQAAATALGIRKAYRDYNEVLADPDVDSVHIGTPNRLHFEMAQRALQARKHVLCEKPLAMTSEEAAQLVRIAADHPQLAAGVNYNIRFYPLVLEMRERIRNGQIGEIFHITGSYTQDWLLYENDYNWRVLSTEGGELRAVADIGTHWLDLVHAVTGLEVESVCADLQTVHPVRRRPLGEVETFQSPADAVANTETVDISTEDAGSILFKFQGTARGAVHVLQVTAGRKNCLRLEIAGAESSLAWNSEDPNELWIGHRARANESLIRDPALISGPARQAATYPGGHNEGYPDSFKHCFRTFYEFIRTGDFTAPAPFPTFQDGHREIELCEAILRSHREQRWIPLAGE